MANAEMRPARAARLEWLAPDGADEAEFARIRVRLERIASNPQREIVYTAKRRTIYRVEDPVLGPIGLKEVRNRSPLRRLRFGHLQEHRAVREFRVGAAFQARGGATPRLLGTALERDRLGLRRVLIFSVWLDGAETLTRHLARIGEPLPLEILDAVARFLVSTARAGLVHGRHSSENVLVVANAGAAPQLLAIDFAYAQLADGFDPRAFVRDAARVARRLLMEEACSRQAVDALLERVARAAWGESEQAEQGRLRLSRELDRILRTRKGR